MKRKSFRILLGVMLAISTAFAAWGWLRPYDWSAEDAARSRIVGVELSRDHSNFWLVAHLKVDAEKEHDLRKPVRLLTAAGKELEPADTTLGGSAGKSVSELWLRFWLEEEDLSGPLELRLNDGKLAVRSGAGVPRLRSSGRKIFTTSRW